MTMQKKVNSKILKILLIGINVVLILFAVFYVNDYSENVQKKNHETEISNFCDTMETMKTISQGYFGNEKMGLLEWVDYIESQSLTKEDALEYIHIISRNNDRYANIVDMDTLEAWSSYTESYSQNTETYQKFLDYSQESKDVYLGSMQEMFENRDNISILGKYMDQQTQTNVVSLGVPITLKENGTEKKYLLLRVIPVSTMMKMWQFPVSYQNAEVGLISKSGDYVIQSRSMRSQSFLEFISSYNSQDEDATIDNLQKTLLNNDKKLMSFKDSRGEDCYWYYSLLSDNSQFAIIGMIPETSLEKTENYNMSLVAMVCVIVGILCVLDGAYAYGMNRLLRISVKQAEEASNAKTRFLSSMSHDIRTPMNAVIGMATLAKGSIDDKEYVNDCLNKILLSGNLLLTLINDILDISKIESGKILIREEPFSLHELLTSLEAIIRPQAEVKGIKLEVNKENLQIDYLIGDELRLSQIYLNLLTNAVKYTKSNGRVCYSISETVLSVDMIQLTMIVSDNGIGMNEEYQKVMYDSFTRESDSRIAKIHGSGLGLYIVKKLVDQMQGTIVCHSVVDEGTTFIVRINLKIAGTGNSKDDNPLIEKEELTGIDLSDIRILIAEDNDLNWEIIQQILNESGIQCDRAENGEICVRMLREKKPQTYDMIFMDIQMPVMNGLETTRVIRKSERKDLRIIPIIAMTADAFAEDVQACKDAGMNAHLTKPLNFEKVLETIRIMKMQGEKHES